MPLMRRLTNAEALEQIDLILAARRKVKEASETLVKDKSLLSIRERLLEIFDDLHVLASERVAAQRNRRREGEDDID